MCCVCCVLCVCVCVCCVVFCFQAEDGIRDLVRSRGLGDVYKRQQRMLPEGGTVRVLGRRSRGSPGALRQVRDRREAQRSGFDARGGRPHQCRGVPVVRGEQPVSYTPLTLPTSDLV